MVDKSFNEILDKVKIKLLNDDNFDLSQNNLDKEFNIEWEFYEELLEDCELIAEREIPTKDNWNEKYLHKHASGLFVIQEINTDFEEDTYFINKSDALDFIEKNKKEIIFSKKIDNSHNKDKAETINTYTVNLSKLNDKILFEENTSVIHMANEGKIIKIILDKEQLEFVTNFLKNSLKISNEYNDLIQAKVDDSSLEITIISDLFESELKNKNIKFEKHFRI